MNYFWLLLRLLRLFLGATIAFTFVHSVFVGLSFWLHDALCCEAFASLLALILFMVYADKTGWKKSESQNNMPMIIGIILCFMYMSVVFLNQWWLTSASLATLCYCLYLLEIPQRESIRDMQRVYLMIFLCLASIIGTYWALIIWKLPTMLSDVEATLLMSVSFAVYLRWLSVEE